MKLVIFVVFGLLIVKASPAQENWRFNNRIQVGAFHDNNIFESVQNVENSMVSSAIFQTQGRRQFNKLRFNYSYSNGLQFYQQHGEEHKVTQIINAEAIWPVYRKLQINAAAGGTAKFFLNAPFDFIYSHSSVRIQYFFPYKIIATAEVEGTQLEYAETDQFDYFNRNFRASLQRRIGNRLLMESGYLFARANFQRPAYLETGDGFFLEKPEPQQDEQNTFFLRGTFGKKYIFRLTSEYIQNSSNSIGYAYSGFRFSGIGAVHFQEKWLIRMAVILQDKKYKEAINPVNLLEFDLERSETNSAVFDLSYDFRVDLSVLARFSFYKNESGLRGRFYEKDLIFLGMEYRF
ncbi:MAG: hypothetical protein DWQ05_12300 [Calditrichaeota bacterium]|nr:MAG: hypothetical protein DWQ05_12300 [Calditrichota bacterium]